MKASVFFVGLMAVTLLANAQRLGFTMPPGKTKVQFPIEIHENLVLVPLTINNKLPLKFILDTGVSTSILTEKAYADILQLPYFKKFTIAGNGNSKFVDAYITNNVSMDLPGISGKGHTLLVLDQDLILLRNYLGTEVHGILGYELFSRFVVKVDYQKKQLTVMLPAHFKSKKGYQSVSMRIENTKPYIKVNLEMNDSIMVTNLFVDSGASHGLFLQSENATLKTPGKHVNTILGRGIGGEITGKLARVKSIKIGTHTLQNVLAGFPDTPGFSDSIPESRFESRDGSIGGEVLSRFTVIYNFPQEMLYLKKNVAFNRVAYFDLSGITVIATGKHLDRFVISAIRENSPAQQTDVLAGDVIVNINGHPASELGLEAIIKQLNTRPGKEITLRLDRNGESIKRKLTLQELL